MATDFLRVNDLQQSNLVGVLERASSLRSSFTQRIPGSSLAGRRAAWIWDGEGFRNRAAFELAISLLGGSSVRIPGRLGEREEIGDVARYLDNWFDVLVVRTPSFANLTELAAAASAPVINARTSHNHPCEILGDLAFVAARRPIDQLHVVFIGDATNLAHSWFEAAAVLPIAVTQVSPPAFAVDHSWFEQLSSARAGSVRWTDDLRDAVRTADIVYTDAWPAPPPGAGPDDVRDLFLPYQVTGDHLDLVPSGSVFLPCPPVTRGEEVSDDFMVHRSCAVYEAKDWLLPAQAALLEFLLLD